MDFGSDYILVLDNEDDDEMSISDDSDYDDEDTACFECEVMEFNPVTEETPPSIAKEKKNISTNILKVDLTKLKEEPDERIEEKYWTKCDNPDCGAYFSENDEWIKDDKGYWWKCKFCSKDWYLNNDDKRNHKPKKYDVCYESDEIHTQQLLVDEYKIIFVMDNSGSMGRKMQVPLKEDTLKELWSKSDDDQKKQSSPEKEGIEVSWLQAVQASVIDLIGELKIKEPKRRIGLVTFNDIVTIYDSTKTVDVVGADLENKAAPLSIGEKNADLKPISETADALKKRLEELKDGGRTALGPALMVALGMVHNSRGSRIIVCTDGAANIGFGKLEEGLSKEDEKFYQQVTSKAKIAGASISIISFDNCELKVLERLARGTGGTIALVSPTDLSKPLKDELQKKTIATNVIVTFLVHKDLYVNEKTPDKEKKTENKSSVSPYVGNVTDIGEQSICFEFAFLQPSQVQQQHQQHQNLQVIHSQQPLYGNNMGQGEQGTGCTTYTPNCQPSAPVMNTTSTVQNYPFQIQISYKDKDDKQLTRVWTKLCPITQSREKAEQAMNPDATVTSFVQGKAKDILDLKQKTQQAELKKKAINIINEAKRYKSEDRIVSDQKLIGKLNNLIDTLEKLAEFGLTDEVCADLSNLAGK